jgi:hydroxymethylpyrimidine pyrophosphatase-like HAD family hydrolase
MSLRLAGTRRELSLVKPLSSVTSKYRIQERLDFERYDKQHQIRSKFIDVLSAQFAHLDLTYSIGGQISFDVFPKGWDKTYALSRVENEGFDEIHFFGDKTYQVPDFRSCGTTFITSNRRAEMTTRSSLMREPSVIPSAVLMIHFAFSRSCFPTRTRACINPVVYGQI